MNLPPEDSAVGQAAETLRQWIASGRLVPGQRLVEPDLTAELMVSRTSLRAAFRSLASEGAVVIEQFKGASVKRLSRQQIQEVFEAREVLEGLAARKAAMSLNGTPALRRLEALMTDMRRASARIGMEAQYGEMNIAFHAEICAAAQSEYLTSLIRKTTLPAIVRVLHQKFLAPRSLQRSMAQHEAIYAALIAGKARSAEEAMRAHIRDSLGSLADLPDTYF